MKVSKKKLSYIKKTFVKQQDSQDCGVACLLSLIRYHGGNNTIENLRSISGTNNAGTTLMGLYQGANQIGFTAEGCKTEIESLILHPTPIILHTTIDKNFNHFLIFFGLHDNGKYVIGDPDKGILFLTNQELSNIWLSKSCLTLECTDHFKLEKNINKEKYQLIIKLIKDDYGLLSVATAIGILLAFLGLGMAIFTQKLVDEIIPNKNILKLNIGVLFVSLILFLKEVLSALRQYLMLQQSKKINLRIIDFFLGQMLKMPFTFFYSRKIGDFVARLNDANRIQRTISQIVGNVIIDILIIIVTLFYIFSYSTISGIISLSTLPFYFVLVYFQRFKIVRYQKNVMSNYAKTESNYISTLQGIEPIKNFNKEEHYKLLNFAVYEKYQNEIITLGKLQIKVSLLTNCFGLIFQITILLFISYAVIGAKMKIGGLMAVLSLVSSLIPSVNGLALISLPISEAKIAFDRMYEFSFVTPKKQMVEETPIIFKSIRLTNISFRFPGRPAILKNINLEVKVGEIIAILGENGSGKSTISQIIQKNLLIESGKIEVNDSLYLSEINSLDWRSIVSSIPQNIHIFNTTILENIAFEDSYTKQKEVIEFLIDNGFGEFFKNLPQSIYTIVGEGGINLSGGQKQLVAIARALYHNPRFLILDEATSAMDRETENFILKVLMKLQKGIAIIFITHKLHILKSFCNKIYIIENGKCIIEGNHGILMKSNNLYSQYWSDLN